jgi:hypothetical protein
VFAPNVLHHWLVTTRARHHNIPALPVRRRRRWWCDAPPSALLRRIGALGGFPFFFCYSFLTLRLGRIVSCRHLVNPAQPFTPSCACLTRLAARAPPVIVDPMPPPPTHDDRSRTMRVVKRSHSVTCGSDWNKPSTCSLMHPIHSIILNASNRCIIESPRAALPHSTLPSPPPSYAALMYMSTPPPRTPSSRSEWVEQASELVDAEAGESGVSGGLGVRAHARACTALYPTVPASWLALC